MSKLQTQKETVYVLNVNHVSGTIPDAGVQWGTDQPWYSWSLEYSRYSRKDIHRAGNHEYRMLCEHRVGGYKGTIPLAMKY